MTITLSLTITRPTHLQGRGNNLLLLNELVTVLDGVGVPVLFSATNTLGAVIIIEMERADDAMEEPMTDEEDAFNWAMDRIKAGGNWLHAAITHVDVVAFEPDEPAVTEQEVKAQAGLGVCPFSE